MECNFSAIEESILEKMESYEISDDKYRVMYDDSPLFDLQNFDPVINGKQLPAGGGWVKVRKQDKIMVVFAESANRERYFNHLMAVKSTKKITSYSVNELGREAKKLEESLEKAHFYELCLSVGIAQPYMIKYRRSRTKWEYLHPHEYDPLLSDITSFIECAMDREVSSIIVKPIFQSDSDKDVVFYLRSRGISKEQALIMAKLKQCYFEWDVQESLNEAYQKVTA